jgi:phospholipid transport system transporter-binding protein
LARKAPSSAADPAASAVARIEGNRLRLAGPVTFATVPTLLEEGNLHIRAGVSIIDFAATTEADSASVALAIAWLRTARASQRKLEFVNLPPAMLNLARLYGVTDLVSKELRDGAGLKLLQG